MALIQKIDSPATPGATRKHAPVHRCEYTSFTAATGELIFQIATFGTDGRAKPDQPSLFLQFDEPAARKLKELLDKVFPVTSP